MLLPLDCLILPPYRLYFMPYLVQTKAFLPLLIPMCWPPSSPPSPPRPSGTLRMRSCSTSQRSPVALSVWQSGEYKSANQQKLLARFVPFVSSSLDSEYLDKPTKYKIECSPVAQSSSCS